MVCFLLHYTHCNEIVVGVYRIPCLSVSRLQLECFSFAAVLVGRNEGTTLRWLRTCDPKSIPQIQCNQTLCTVTTARWVKFLNSLRLDEAYMHHSWQIILQKVVLRQSKNFTSNTVIWITLSVFLNSLWPSDAIWCKRSGSILAQVMACCLMAPT